MTTNEKIAYVKKQLCEFLVESDVFLKDGLKVYKDISIRAIDAIDNPSFEELKQYNKKFGLLVCRDKVVVQAIELFEETLKEGDRNYHVPSIEFSIEDMEVHEMEDVVEEWIEKELASGLKEKFLLKEDRVEK